MKNKVIMWLEEYARHILQDIENLIDEENTDGNEDAGKEARRLEAKVAEVRRVVSYLSIRGHLKD